MRADVIEYVFVRGVALKDVHQTQGSQIVEHYGEGHLGNMNAATDPPAHEGVAKRPGVEPAGLIDVFSAIGMPVGHGFFSGATIVPVFCDVIAKFCEMLSMPA